MESYLYILPIVFVGILQGGYFVYTSAALSAIMLIGITFYIIRNKKIYVPWDINIMAIFIVCIMY